LLFVRDVEEHDKTPRLLFCPKNEGNAKLSLH
jgi:hypothetical protein